MSLVKWLAGPRAVEEIRQEFRRHRDECRTALLADGLTHEAAESAARHRFGDEEAYAKRCEQQLLDERLGELRCIGSIATACGLVLVGLLYLTASDTSLAFQRVFCLHLVYGLPLALAAGACAARLGYWLARFGLLGLGVMVLWLGLFLGTHMGYGAWQSSNNPPDEAFADGAKLVGTLLAGWLPSSLLVGLAYVATGILRRSTA
jgi:hypothetical protein